MDRVVACHEARVIAILCALIVIVFFWVAFSKPKLIPGKMQSLGEMAILGVRDQIMRPQLGKKGDKYLGYIVVDVLLDRAVNLMELVPVIQFPVMSRIGFVIPLVGDHVRPVLVPGVQDQGVLGAISSPGFRDAPLFSCRC